MQGTELMINGFVRVPYPPNLSVNVKDAMDSWKGFCSLPQEEKLRLSLGDRHKDIGYVLRLGEGANHDHKEFFHASVGMPQEIRARAKEVSDTRATEFLDATEVLVEHVTPLIQSFAHLIETWWGIEHFERDVMDNRHNWKFRYLHYFPSESGEPIAHPHADRGGFTLHLNESHPGAQYLNFKGQWRPLPVSENETVIFPSIMLQHRSGSRLQALCHQVLATPEAAKEGRFSMVAFVDFLSDVRFNDRGYRMQDLEPGFNYGLSESELGKYFVPRE